MTSTKMNLEECLRFIPAYDQLVPESPDTKVAYFCNAGHGHDGTTPISFIITTDDQVFAILNSQLCKVEQFSNQNFTRVWAHFNVDCSIDVIFLSRTGKLCIGWTNGNFDLPPYFAISAKVVDGSYADVALEGHLPVMLLLTNSGEAKLCLMNQWEPWSLLELTPWEDEPKKIASLTCSGWYAAMVTSDGELYVFSLGTSSRLSPHTACYRLISYPGEVCVKFAFLGHHLLWIDQHAILHVEIEPYRESSSDALVVRDIAIFGNCLATIHHGNLYHVWTLRNCSPFLNFYKICDPEYDAELLLPKSSAALMRWSFGSYPSRQSSTPQIDEQLQTKRILWYENDSQSSSYSSETDPDDNVDGWIPYYLCTAICESRIPLESDTNVVDTIGNAATNSLISCSSVESVISSRMEKINVLERESSLVCETGRNQVRSTFDFSAIWGDAKISDTQVRLQDGIVPLHRTILFLNSNYFKNHMALRHDSSFLDFSEEDPLVFRAYLEYVYTQKVPNWVNDTGIMVQLNALAQKNSEANLILETTPMATERMSKINF